MRASQVDERSTGGELSDPVFRVVLYDGGPESWSVDTWDLSDCGALDAIRWAQENVGTNGAWALGLVDPEPANDHGHPMYNITYLEGYDPNSQPGDRTPWEDEQINAMVRRGGTPVLGV